MNALLLASQLIIPQIPANVTEDNFIKATIETYDCVEAVEEDGVVHALDEKTGEESTVARLIVSVKEGYKTKACAKQISKELDLTIDSVFSIIPAFVVSYTVPVLPANETQKPVTIQINN